MAGTANSVNGPEAAPYLAKAGGTMTGSLILNAAPSTTLQAATKGYVDNVALNTLTACVCASTAALTVTYDNGTAGVGATLTNAGAMAAFSVDGISPSVNDRVLIKNQASGLQNGIYTVTTVGSGAVNWVLTRATDYDEAAEMQAGDKVAVVQGTTQSATEWMMTQTAAITVGVTSITWAEMGQVTAAVTAIAEQNFNTAGGYTYTPTAGMIYCIIEVIGAGGGGGGAAGVAATSSGGGGGGGSGAYSRSVKTAAQVGASQAVTIGAGGAGGAAGNNNGSAGAASSVGALVTANGGAGGTGSAAAAGAAFGGAGGVGGTTGGTGDLKVSGGPGSPGLVISGVGGIAVGGYGGSIGLNVGSPPNIGADAGAGPGGGGAGGAGLTADDAGVAGGDGQVIITEFLSTSA